MLRPVSTTSLLDCFLLVTVVALSESVFAQLQGDLPAAVAEIYHDTGTALEGHETSFFCLVTNFNPSHLVQFSHNNVTLTSNSQVVITGESSERYSVYKAGGTLTRFYLTIADTTRKDTGQYGCHVLTSSFQKTTEISSSYVGLSVHYLPLPSYPTCHSEPKTDDLTFLEGDQVTLSCLSAGGNPPISLTWEGLGSSSTSSSSTTVSADGIMVNRLTLQPQDGAFLTCLLNFDTEIFIGEAPRNCSIGPFSILPRPRVTLEPPNVIAQVGSIAQFRCVVEDAPESARIYRDWLTSPTVPSDRLFLNVDKTIVLVQNVSESDNKTIVTCQASTILGSIEASGILTVVLKDPSVLSSSCESTQHLESTTNTYNGTTLLTSSTSSTTSNVEAKTQQTNLTTYSISTVEATSNESPSSRTPETTQSLPKHTRYVEHNGQSAANKDAAIDALDQTEGQEMCQVITDNNDIFIIAIIIVSVVSLLALVADILLILKLFRRSKSVQLQFN